MIGHTNRQTEIIPFNILEWEPRFAWTFRFKCLRTQLRTFNPSQELFRGSAEFPDQNLRKIGQGPGVHDGHSNRQRTRDYNRCIYRFILRYCFRKCGSVQKDTVVVSGKLLIVSCLCNLCKYKKKCQLCLFDFVILLLQFIIALKKNFMFKIIKISIF